MMFLPSVAVRATLVTTLVGLATASAVAQQKGTPTLQPKAEFVASDGDIKKVLITPDGKTLIGCGPYTVHIWRLDTSVLVSKRTIAYPENLIQDIEIDSSGRMLAYLSSGLQSEVVFISLETGQRVNAQTGKPIVDAADRPGSGSWQLPRIPLKTAVARDLALKSADGGISEVAVAYSSGLIEMLDLSTGRPRTLNTNSPGLRSIGFGTDGRIVWVSPQGYGTEDGGKPVTFHNFDSYFLNDQLWMVSGVDDQPLVRTYDMKAHRASDVKWQTSTPVVDLVPTSKGYFVMYDTGEIGVHDFKGAPSGKPWFFAPRLAQAKTIKMTNMAVSPTALIVATIRGPVVSVYELSTGKS